MRSPADTLLHRHGYPLIFWPSEALHKMRYSKSMTFWNLTQFWNLSCHTLSSGLHHHIIWWGMVFRGGMCCWRRYSQKSVGFFLLGSSGLLGFLSAKCPTITPQYTIYECFLKFPKNIFDIHPYILFFVDVPLFHHSACYPFITSLMAPFVLLMVNFGRYFFGFSLWSHRQCEGVVEHFVTSSCPFPTPIQFGDHISPLSIIVTNPSAMRQMAVGAWIPTGGSDVCAKI